jgi:transposase
VAGTTALGLDEVAFRRANARRHISFATNFVDLMRRRLVDVVPGRSAKAVQDWLGTRSPERLADVRTVAIDPFRARPTVWPSTSGGSRWWWTRSHVIAQPGHRRRARPGAERDARSPGPLR